MANIQVFSSNQFGEIRTIVAEDGEPRFCLADVCKSLNLKLNGITRRLAKGVISNHPLSTAGGEQQALFVNEDGLYDTILDSRKPEAKAFRKWVTGEVLPSIRRNGGYMVTRQDETPEEIMARALLLAQNTLDRHKERIAQLESETANQAARLEAQEQQIAQSASKVKYYDDVLNSVTTMTTRQVASSIGMDAHKLNIKLREAGIQYRQSGQWFLHAPFNRFGFHKTRTSTYTRSDGSIGTESYTVWTHRGARFFAALSENDWNVRKAMAAINTESKAQEA